MVEGAVDLRSDTGKIDDAALALLYLTLHEGSRVWKSHDCDVLNRLYEQGLISDPVRKGQVGRTH